MSAAIIKLERFADQTPTDLPEKISAELLEQAFLSGFQNGQEIAKQSKLAELSHHISELCLRLEDERNADRQRRRDMLNELVPILGAILETIGPIGLESRLEVALRAELDRLVDNAPYKRCTIRCSPDLSEVIARAAGPYDPKALRIVEDPDCTAVEIAVDGGFIVFDQKIVARKLAELIHSITSKD